MYDSDSFALNEKSRTIQESIPNPMFEERNRQYLEKESHKRVAFLLSKNTKIHKTKTKTTKLYFSIMSVEKLSKMNSDV
jgi:hypothetical protein